MPAGAPLVPSSVPLSLVDTPGPGGVAGLGHRDQLERLVPERAGRRHQRDVPLGDEPVAGRLVEVAAGVERERPEHLRRPGLHLRRNLVELGEGDGRRQWVAGPVEHPQRVVHGLHHVGAAHAQSLVGWLQVELGARVDARPCAHLVGVGQGVEPAEPRQLSR